MENKENYKLTDQQFLEALIENNGIFVLVAKEIQAKYGVTYSRQAVRERAQNFSEELKELRETIIDYSEGRLIKIIADDSADSRLGARLAQYMLNSLGKNRGYGKNGNDDILNEKPEQIFKAGKNIMRF
jgi:hypothetical protein